MTQEVIEPGPRRRHYQLMKNSVSARPNTQLRFVLAANGTTSGLAGLVALVDSGRVDEWLGTGHPGWVRVVGAGLVVFAFAVIALSRSNVQRVRRWVPAISVADGGWVAASFATLIAGWYSNRGTVIIAAIALVVGTFAIEQILLSPTRPAPATA